jgi:hypothetical protein
VYIGLGSLCSLKEYKVGRTSSPTMTSWLEYGYMVITSYGYRFMVKYGYGYEPPNNHI